MGKIWQESEMKQAAAVQISLLLLYQSISEVSSAGSPPLHKHQSSCQDIASTMKVGADATLFCSLAKFSYLPTPLLSYSVFKKALITLIIIHSSSVERK